MRPRTSLLSVLAVLSLSFLLFALAGTSPATSVVYADNSTGGGLPADTCADSACTSLGDNDPAEESFIDVLVDLIDAVL